MEVRGQKIKVKKVTVKFLLSARLLTFTLILSWTTVKLK
jgi:hypothetical protein